LPPAHALTAMAALETRPPSGSRSLASFCRVARADSGDRLASFCPADGTADEPSLGFVLSGGGRRATRRGRLISFPCSAWERGLGCVFARRQVLSGRRDGAGDADGPSPSAVSEGPGSVPETRRPGTLGDAPRTASVRKRCAIGCRG